MFGSSNDYRYGHGKWVPKNKSYRDGKGLKQPVQDLLSASGVDLNRGGGFKKRFQNYLSDYKIIVYDGLSPDRAPFSGNSLSNMKFTSYTILDTTMLLRT
jgi:hypothetical protein